MSQHTPGPWKQACGARGTTCRHPAILWDGGQVGNATWQGSEAATDANARLIAAAPELLEFAEEVRRTGDTRLASMAIAVIAKAIGEAK